MRPGGELSRHDHLLLAATHPPWQMGGQVAVCPDVFAGQGWFGGRAVKSPVTPTLVRIQHPPPTPSPEVRLGDRRRVGALRARCAVWLVVPYDRTDARVVCVVVAAQRGEHGDTRFRV